MNGAGGRAGGPWPALLALAACATPPPAPLALPPVRVELDYYSGSPLEGPQALASAPSSAPSSARSSAPSSAATSSRTSTASAPACGPYTLRYTLLALSELPEEAASLAPLVCMVARPTSPTPVRAVVEGAAKVRAASGAEARAFQARTAAAPDTVARAAATGASVVAKGLTTALRVVDSERPLSAAALLVALAGEQVDLVLATDGGAGLELSQLSACSAASSPWLFAWPRALPARPNAAMAVLVELAPTTPEDCAAILATARARALVTGQAAAAKGLTPTLEKLLVQRREQILRVIAADTNARRSALVQLAQEAGAWLSAGLAVVADSGTVDTFAKQIAPRSDLAEAPLQALGFELDLAAYLILLDLADRGSLTPALASLLTTHAGEVGQDTNTLLSILERAIDRASLDRMILRENLAYLGENEPVRRVNAFDWLARRGAAPPGYDPLAERSARRSALRAWEHALAKKEER